MLMGYRLSKAQAEKVFQILSGKYDILAPVRMKGDGCFADTDVIRYGKVTSPDEIVWDRRSDYSYKEALLPVNETLFYFTENNTAVPEEMKKEQFSTKRGKFKVLCSFMSCGSINADDGIFRGPLRDFACTKSFHSFFKPPAQPVVFTILLSDPQCPWESRPTARQGSRPVNLFQTET